MEHRQLDQSESVKLKSPEIPTNEAAKVEKAISRGSQDAKEVVHLE